MSAPQQFISSDEQDSVSMLSIPSAASEAPVVYGGSATVGRTLGQVERDLILDTLNLCHGNRTHAANIVGISIRTLRNKLHEYANAGLPIPAARSRPPELLHKAHRKQS